MRAPTAPGSSAAAWFASRDLVIALDDGHRHRLLALAPTPQDAAKVRLLRSFDPALPTGAGLDVPDPYYGGMDGFEECLAMCEAACEGLLDAVREELARRGPVGAEDGVTPRA